MKITHRAKLGSAIFVCILGTAASAAALNSLYMRLGGEPAITAVVEEFVARAAADPKVNFTRKGEPRQWNPTPEALKKLKGHLVAFISSATGGPQKYSGLDMKTAHTQMKITSAQFDALAADLIGALDKYKVPQKEKDELIAIVSTTKKDIVEVN